MLGKGSAYDQYVLAAPGIAVTSPVLCSCQPVASTWHAFIAGLGAGAAKCHLSSRKQGGGRRVPCSGNAEQRGRPKDPAAPHSLGSVASTGAVPCNEAPSWWAPAPCLDSTCIIGPFRPEALSLRGWIGRSSGGLCRSLVTQAITEVSGWRC